MKLYGGIDLHSNNCVIAIVNGNGEKLLTKRLDNDLTVIQSFLKPYKNDLTGLVVESTFNWYWLVDALMEDGFQMHLANPSAIQQYSGLKHADDKTDARWLAEMLRLDVLPEGYIYPKEMRSVRDLMRKRMDIVQQSTKNLLSIQSCYMRHLGYKPSSNKIKQMAQCFEETNIDDINQTFSSAHTSTAVYSNLALLRCAQQQIKHIESQVLKQVSLSPEFRLLTSIDGIGKVLALTIMLETGTIERFASAGNFASYCRCVNGSRTSNGKKKGSTNIKNGNRYLAWAFIEAANFAMRYNPAIKKYYQRKLARTNRNIALKTVAHKLARACYHVLKSNVAFEDNKAFS
ncbi:IS110 family transposase [Thalassotalea sp. PS06]|nr:IS110 family transposase [Thalassotalea sp. PS06]QDP02941.1 IS110 family transposase [Thalassotalea sp. PS06]QDP03069.1 IS110 family transposase [Thalassotalea sp. PS06]QDP03071.1 IS110 family transposase [Thalassotalea sp. PS06]